MAEPMTLAQCKAAIQLHGITHGHEQQVHGARGDSERATRCGEISAAAAGGLLLPPIKGEQDISELVTAASQFGLLAPVTLPTPE